MTALELANEALLRLGVAPISSFADGTDVANNVVRLFVPTMNTLTIEGDWHFAKKRDVLSENTTVTNLTNHPYAYDPPADALEIVSMKPADIGFEIENGVLYTEAEPDAANNMPSVLYRARVCELVGGDPQIITGITPSQLFETAFVVRLAAKLAMKLRASMQLTAQLQQEAQYYLQIGNLMAISETPGNQSEAFTFLGGGGGE